MDQLNALARRVPTWVVYLLGLVPLGFLVWGAFFGGLGPDPVKAIERGERCSWFYPSTTPATVRKQWIAGALKPAGEIYVDAGAAHALRGGKSLLPAGVLRVTGKFERGDALVVRDAHGAEIARGLSAYSSADAERLRGRRSSEIAELLGFHGRDELIHRDDLVLTGSGRSG